MERSAMTEPENYDESFVVRVWREPREIGGAAPIWRGSIEHVNSRKRLYLNDLDNDLDAILKAIVAFMAEYLYGWGVKPKS
jgi:hypothetical protein